MFRGCGIMDVLTASVTLPAGAMARTTIGARRNPARASIVARLPLSLAEEDLAAPSTSPNPEVPVERRGMNVLARAVLAVANHKFASATHLGQVSLPDLREGPCHVQAVRVGEICRGKNLGHLSNPRKRLRSMSTASRARKADCCGGDPAGADRLLRCPPNIAFDFRSRDLNPATPGASPPPPGVLNPAAPLLRRRLLAADHRTPLLFPASLSPSSRGYAAASSRPMTRLPPLGRPRQPPIPNPLRRSAARSPLRAKSMPPPLPPSCPSSPPAPGRPPPPIEAHLRRSGAPPASVEPGLRRSGARPPAPRSTPASIRRAPRLG